MEDEKYEDYLLGERKSLLFAQSEQAKSFDRWVLTLAGGTFGLSLIFIYQIAPNPKSVGCLVTAWACFAASICFTLSSFLLSQEAHHQYIEAISKLSNREAARENKLPPTVYGRVTKALNYGSMIVFLIGVVFLIVFAKLNLSSIQGG